MNDIIGKKIFNTLLKCNMTIKTRQYFFTKKVKQNRMERVTSIRFEI